MIELALSSRSYFGEEHLACYVMTYVDFLAVKGVADLKGHLSTKQEVLKVLVEAIMCPSELLFCAKKTELAGTSPVLIKLGFLRQAFFMLYPLRYGDCSTNEWISCRMILKDIFAEIESQAAILRCIAIPNYVRVMSLQPRDKNHQPPQAASTSNTEHTVSREASEQEAVRGTKAKQKDGMEADHLGSYVMSSVIAVHLDVVKGISSKDTRQIILRHMLHKIITDDCNSNDNPSQSVNTGVYLAFLRQCIFSVFPEDSHEGRRERWKHCVEYVESLLPNSSDNSTEIHVISSVSPEPEEISQMKAENTTEDTALFLGPPCSKEVLGATVPTTQEASEINHIKDNLQGSSSFSSKETVVKELIMNLFTEEDLASIPICRALRRLPCSALKLARLRYAYFCLFPNHDMETERAAWVLCWTFITTIVRSMIGSNQTFLSLMSVPRTRPEFKTAKVNDEVQEVPEELPRVPFFVQSGAVQKECKKSYTHKVPQPSRSKSADLVLGKQLNADKLGSYVMTYREAKWVRDLKTSLEKKNLSQENVVRQIVSALYAPEDLLYLFYLKHNKKNVFCPLKMAIFHQAFFEVFPPSPLASHVGIPQECWTQLILMAEHMRKSTRKIMIDKGVFSMKITDLLQWSTEEENGGRAEIITIDPDHQAVGSPCESPEMEEPCESEMESSRVIPEMGVLSEPFFVMSGAVTREPWGKLTTRQVGPLAQPRSSFKIGTTDTGEIVRLVFGVPLPLHKLGSYVMTEEESKWVQKLKKVVKALSLDKEESVELIAQNIYSLDEIKRFHDRRRQKQILFSPLKFAILRQVYSQICLPMKDRTDRVSWHSCFAYFTKVCENLRMNGITLQNTADLPSSSEKSRRGRKSRVSETTSDIAPEKEVVSSSIEKKLVPLEKKPLPVERESKREEVHKDDTAKSEAAMSRDQQIALNYALRPYFIRMLQCFSWDVNITIRYLMSVLFTENELQQYADSSKSKLDENKVMAFVTTYSYIHGPTEATTCLSLIRQAVLELAREQSSDLWGRGTAKHIQEQVEKCARLIGYKGSNESRTGGNQPKYDDGDTMTFAERAYVCSELLDEDIKKLPKFKLERCTYVANELVQTLFTLDELMMSNTTGSRGMCALDPKRVAILKHATFTIAGVAASQREKTWVSIHQTVDHDIRSKRYPFLTDDRRIEKLLECATVIITKGRGRSINTAAAPDIKIVSCSSLIPSGLHRDLLINAKDPTEVLKRLMTFVMLKEEDWNSFISRAPSKMKIVKAVFLSICQVPACEQEGTWVGAMVMLKKVIAGNQSDPSPRERCIDTLQQQESKSAPTHQERQKSDSIEKKSVVDHDEAKEAKDATPKQMQTRSQKNTSPIPTSPRRTLRLKTTTTISPPAMSRSPRGSRVERPVRLKTITTGKPPANSSTVKPPANSSTVKPPANSSTVKPPANTTTIKAPTNVTPVKKPVAPSHSQRASGERKPELPTGVDVLSEGTYQLLKCFKWNKDMVVRILIQYCFSHDDLDVLLQNYKKLVQEKLQKFAMCFEKIYPGEQDQCVQLLTQVAQNIRRHSKRSLCNVWTKKSIENSVQKFARATAYADSQKQKTLDASAEYKAFVRAEFPWLPSGEVAKCLFVADHLRTCFFTMEEIVFGNCAGAQGCLGLDPGRLAIMKHVVEKVGSVPAHKINAIWRMCCTTMDRKNRKLRKQVIEEDEQVEKLIQTQPDVLDKRIPAKIKDDLVKNSDNAVTVIQGLVQQLFSPEDLKSDVNDMPPSQMKLLQVLFFGMHKVEPSSREESWSQALRTIDYLNKVSGYTFKGGETENDVESPLSPMSDGRNDAVDDLPEVHESSDEETPATNAEVPTSNAEAHATNEEEPMEAESSDQVVTTPLTATEKEGEKPLTPLEVEQKQESSDSGEAESETSTPEFSPRWYVLEPVLNQLHKCLKTFHMEEDEVIDELLMHICTAEEVLKSKDCKSDDELNELLIEAFLHLYDVPDADQGRAEDLLRERLGFTLENMKRMLKRLRLDGMAADSSAIKSINKPKAYPPMADQEGKIGKMRSLLAESFKADERIEIDTLKLRKLKLFKVESLMADFQKFCRNSGDEVDRKTAMTIVYNLTVELQELIKENPRHKVDSFTSWYVQQAVSALEEKAKQQVTNPEASATPLFQAVIQELAKVFKTLGFVPVVRVLLKYLFTQEELKVMEGSGVDLSNTALKTQLELMQRTIYRVTKTASSQRENVWSCVQWIIAKELKELIISDESRKKKSLGEMVLPVYNRKAVLKCVMGVYLSLEEQSEFLLDPKNYDTSNPEKVKHMKSMYFLIRNTEEIGRGKEWHLVCSPKRNFPLVEQLSREKTYMKPGRCRERRTLPSDENAEKRQVGAPVEDSTQTRTSMRLAPSVHNGESEKQVVQSDHEEKTASHVEEEARNTMSNQNDANSPDTVQRKEDCSSSPPNKTSEAPSPYRKTIVVLVDFDTCDKVCKIMVDEEKKRSNEGDTEENISADGGKDIPETQPEEEARNVACDSPEKEADNAVEGGKQTESSDVGREHQEEQEKMNGSNEMDSEGIVADCSNDGNVKEQVSPESDNSQDDSNKPRSPEQEVSGDSKPEESDRDTSQIDAAVNILKNLAENITYESEDQVDLNPGFMSSTDLLDETGDESMNEENEPDSALDSEDLKALTEFDSTLLGESVEKESMSNDSTAQTSEQDIGRRKTSPQHEVANDTKAPAHKQNETMDTEAEGDCDTKRNAETADQGTPSSNSSGSESGICEPRSSQQQTMNDSSTVTDLQDTGGEAENQKESCDEFSEVENVAVDLPESTDGMHLVTKEKNESEIEKASVHGHSEGQDASALSPPPESQTSDKIRENDEKSDDKSSKVDDEEEKMETDSSSNGESSSNLHSSSILIDDKPADCGHESAAWTCASKEKEADSATKDQKPVGTDELGEGGMVASQMETSASEASSLGVTAPELESTDVGGTLSPSKCTVKQKDVIAVPSDINKNVIGKEPTQGDSGGSTSSDVQRTGNSGNDDDCDSGQTAKQVSSSCDLNTADMSKPEHSNESDKCLDDVAESISSENKDEKDTSEQEDCSGNLNTLSKSETSSEFQSSESSTASDEKLTNEKDGKEVTHTEIRSQDTSNSAPSESQTTSEVSDGGNSHILGSLSEGKGLAVVTNTLSEPTEKNCVGDELSGQSEPPSGEVGTSSLSDTSNLDILLQAAEMKGQI